MINADGLFAVACVPIQFSSPPVLMNSPRFLNKRRHFGARARNGGSDRKYAAGSRRVVEPPRPVLAAARGSGRLSSSPVLFRGLVASAPFHDDRTSERARAHGRVQTSIERSPHEPYGGGSRIGYHVTGSVEN